MTIRLYNTKTREKEDFDPHKRDDVRMYVCGPTVYDRAHIGNARPVVVFDVLYRLLRHEYGEKSVTYVRNFTDVDDKINAKAAETGRNIREITDETIGWYHDDMDALGALRPDHEPRATDYIGQMIAMTEALIAKGHAYEAEGHVLFEARTDPDYGSLSRRPLDEMKAGARVEVAPYKRDPIDSVMWKPSTGDQPGWDSPWGRGRPGWHIECSAMAGDLLGEAFDIHGGGIDLQFPHHENEWAQSRCMGHDFANIWMHNGYLMVEGEKMSKSLGNFFTVADLREKGVPGEVMRLAMLMTHYRSPLDWTEQGITTARRVLDKWYELIGDAAPEQNAHSSVLAALEDDLNTPKAIAALHELTASSEFGAAAFDSYEFGSRHDPAMLKASANLLGLLALTKSEWDAATETSVSKETVDTIDTLISHRAAAKAAKDFARADDIRDMLTAAGVEVQDKADGAKWSLTPSFDASKLPEVEDV